MIGRILNQRYEILERVGEGAVFQVFKARDRSLNRIVAIKSPQTLFAEDPVFLEALEKASSRVTLLTHTHVAQLYEVRKDDQAPYLVQEFVRGFNLKDRIRRIAPFTLSVATDFAVAICESLQYAHANGIVHGDLRPQNVIVSPEGAVKVTDFGLSAVFSASQQANANNLARAVHYQAPEIASGRSATVASDVYALGVMLFEMLTGGLPFVADTPLATAMKHQQEPVPSPRSINPGVPKSLEGIVMKAIQKRPDLRYLSAADMLNDLKSVHDALRFGKPLSWSPMEADLAERHAPSTDPKVPSESLSSAYESLTGGRASAVTTTIQEDEADQTVSSVAAKMASRTRQDDRISPFLKIALGTVVVVLVVATTVGIAIWFATFSEPPATKFPTLIGMKLDAAQAEAAKIKVRLIEREEFNEKVDAGIIFKTDQEPGRQIRPGRSVIVWVSRGSKMVWVPDLTNEVAERAAQKIKEAGLTLGAVDRQHSDKVDADKVIGQNPKNGKRVERDTAVNLIVSDGPDPAKEVVTPPVTGPGDEPTPEPNSPGPSDDTERRTFNLRIAIKRDGRKLQRVRVEYDDARGTQTPIDEMHNEGDIIAQKVDVYGPNITVRIYYDNEPTPVSEKTEKLPRDRSRDQ